jgi:hypothetical protein
MFFLVNLEQCCVERTICHYGVSTMNKSDKACYVLGITGILDSVHRPVF